MSRFTLIFSLLLTCQLFSQDNDPQANATPTPIPEDGVRVSVLGYHDFSTTRTETEMLISTAKFRKQMVRLKEMGITVISMDQFIAWKQGKASIPDKSVVITIDDGWKSVYTDAYPVLKELKYPFTVYLYKNYIDGGGRALTTKMIRDMVKNGVTLGSHSVSHPFPITFRKFRDKGGDAYDKFLRLEMGESKRYLESRFKTKVKTYTYPGGYLSKEMLPLVHEFNYAAAFTIEPKKVTRLTPIDQIPRYMILGNYDKIFEFATTFIDPNAPTTAATPTAPVTPAQGTHSPKVTAEPTAHPVLPESGAMINSRLPKISADLSMVENLDPESLKMRVSGFAIVPASFDPETKVYSWQVNRRLRHPSSKVLVTWSDTDGNPTLTPLSWSFLIDREAAYLLEDE